MTKFLLNLWQLPQTIIALVVLKIYKCSPVPCPLYRPFWTSDSVKFGVSLGEYRIINRGCTGNTEKHEYGHTRQSRILGWLYLIVIGVPSALFNLYDRTAHKDWSAQKRTDWYYSLPWEKWADRLGDVSR